MISRIPVMVFIALLNLSPMISANQDVGNREGNGGDHIRATFLRMGERVITFLLDTPRGVDLARQHRIDLKALRETLSVRRVSIQESELRDNTGSDVDAVYRDGKIILHKARWAEHFERQRDVYYLVFHEMLRAIGTNDDDFVMSKALVQFPEHLRISTRIAPILPLVSGDLLADSIEPSRIRYNGIGCPGDVSGTYTDFDVEKNILDVSFRHLRIYPERAPAAAETSCSLDVPIKGVPNTRIVVSQIDLGGTVRLEPGMSANIRLEASLAGKSTESHERLFISRESGLHGRVQFRSNEDFKTPCGRSTTMRLKVMSSVTAAHKTVSNVAVNRISLYFKTAFCSSDR